MWANPDVLTFYKTLDQVKLVPLGEMKKSATRKSSKASSFSRFKSKAMKERPILNIS